MEQMSLKESSYGTGNQKLYYYFHNVKNTCPVILIHGIGLSSRYMLPLARELAHTHTVYAIDLPGFGKSRRLSTPASLDGLSDAIADFIVGNSLKQPIVVGHSFGCQVSLKLLKRHKNLISKAILIGPTMNIFERTAVYQIMRWLQNLKYEPSYAMSWILVKDIWACGLRRVHQTLKIGLNDRPEEGLEKIKTPILFVRGIHDPIAPTVWLEFLAKKSPTFVMAELPDAGHALNFSSPLLLARTIKGFLHEDHGKLSVQE